MTSWALEAIEREAMARAHRAIEGRTITMMLGMTPVQIAALARRFHTEIGVYPGDLTNDEILNARRKP